VRWPWRPTAARGISSCASAGRRCARRIAFDFPIEDYLFARGDDYVQKYRAESFLALSESIDLHQMDATQVRTPATLIAVREDQLVPFNDMQACRRA
jgi:homoserine O-acetyltransferase